jgi:hypothetical protein
MGLSFIFSLACSASALAASALACSSADWLVCAPTTPVTVSTWKVSALSGVMLSNGLVSRSWITNASGSPAFGLWDFVSALDGPPGASLLRSLNPEAAVTLNGTAMTAGGVGVAASPRPPLNFTLIASNKMSGCTFVAQGPIQSLAVCQVACWASATCDIINWIPPIGGQAADCVLKACADPFAAPSLSPLVGCFVYATAPAPAPAHAPVSSGPFLNRTGLARPGVLVATPSSLVFAGWTTFSPVARFTWAPGRRGSPPGAQWPPAGLGLTASFTGLPGSPFCGVNVSVHYEMYVGSPSVAKWLTVVPLSSSPPGAVWPVILSALEVERLGVSPSFSPLAPIPYPATFPPPTPLLPAFPSSGKLGLLTDFYYASLVTWINDDANGDTPGSSQPLVTVAELDGLAVLIAPPSALPPGVPTMPGASSGAWTSLRVYELLFDDGPEGGVALPRFPSSETYYGCTLGPCEQSTGTPIMGGLTERRGLTLRRFLSLVAPQALENPLQNHLTASDSASIRASCSQMAQVGWEMLVLSYGSGADVESSDPAYRARIAGDIAFCNALGIEVGAYDLIGWTRSPGRGWDALAQDGSDSGDACFASGWETYLLQAFLSFINSTGLTMVETDGPYAGYGCANSTHTGHHGWGDSVQIQSRSMAATYEALQSRGVYVNAPDSWFLSGISKMGIGYNEGTFRLADVDLISLIQRQVIFDATAYTVPAMAWSQLPMATYDYGSAEGMAQFEAGVAGQLALGIGTFIYQPDGGDFLPTSAVADVLQRWAAWFKTYRVLLSSGDVIHVSRPDGQGVDVTLHARAGADIPALFVLTNPTADNVTLAALTLPLYYAGLPAGAAVLVAWEGGAPGAPLMLDSRSRAVVQDVTVRARSLLWATVVAA